MIHNKKSNKRTSYRKKIGVKPYLGTRLRKWRITNNLKGYELAKLIGISQGSLSDLENNVSHPSANTLALLYLNTTINIIWLLIQEGEMERED